MTWQPVDTAPKDGLRPIDLWVIPVTGRPHRRVGMTWLKITKWSGWRGGKCHIDRRSGYPVGNFIGSECTVTHWMPEPEPPKETL